MSNPFEDPDVKDAQKSYGNSAYDEPKPSEPTSSNNNTDTKPVAMNVTTDAKNEPTKDQSTNAVEKPNWCVSFWNWVAIRYLALLGGLFLITFGIVVTVINVSFLNFLVIIYLVIFGIITVIIEAPSFLLTRSMQLGIFFWFRLLSRTWGRAWFYIFVAILCYVVNDFSIAIGIYYTVVALIMFVFSRLAAQKYVAIYLFILSGSQVDTEMKQKFDAKFDELDLDKDGKIGSLEIVKISKQAGLQLTNAERHAIQSFLDVSCNGSISKEDWWKQFSTFNLNQRFL